MPSAKGIIASEFDVVIPSNLLVTSTVNNPLIVTVGCGCCEPGVHGFYDCQGDSVWTHHLTCMVMAAGVGAPDSIRVVPAPGELSLQVTSCDPGFPTEPVTVLTELHLYEACAYAMEPTSWGAIKSLYQ